MLWHSVNVLYLKSSEYFKKMILIGNQITSNIYAVKRVRAARGIGKLAPLLCFKVKYVQLTDKTDFIHPIYWTFMLRLLTSKPCIRCLSRQKNQTKRKSNSNKLDRKKRNEKKRKKERKLERLLSASGLLLSIVSCTALIHVEVRIQDHRRLILH